MLMTFSVEDAEKVFRFAGQQPFRRGFETLAYYRKKVRPDIYAEYGSLATELEVQFSHKMQLEMIIKIF